MKVFHNNFVSHVIMALSNQSFITSDSHFSLNVTVIAALTERPRTL